MQYKAILFDMDGTLVPMDTDAFVKSYFKTLYVRLAKYQIPIEAFQKAMYSGVAAMTNNNGMQTNEQVFWEVFSNITGIAKETVYDDLKDFYTHEFHTAQCATLPNPYAKEAVRLAHEKAPIVVLATNPLFPIEGQITRMQWVDLRPEDFALVTSYENERYCKPNPQYFLSICERFHLQPKECLVIGNDENEDMHAATLAGMDAYLVTDCRIPSAQHPWNGPSGTFTALLTLLQNLEAC